MFQFDHSYSRLSSKLYTKVSPVPVEAPKLVIFNQNLANEMGINYSKIDSQTRLKIFSGNQLPLNALPLAQAYAGHQFGHFTVLGDGRVILLGEHLTLNKKRYDIQLKGSGKTPYSRRGDGRAALKPMLREYLMSEAMFGLGIPTTRGLAVTTTGEDIYRETPLPGAILTRVASSHIRIGTFEYIALKQNKDLLKSFLSYTIKRHFPECIKVENQAFEFLKAVSQKQINLIVNWMRVGFIHGVMNTDNVSICAETIDYGPCAFMDHYDPMTVFSSIDYHGRYSFGNQPKIAQWNLDRLAKVLLPLIDFNQQKAMEMAKDVIEKFSVTYENQWFSMMKQKLGLLGDDNGDSILIKDLLEWMFKVKADYTNVFQALKEKSLTNTKFDEDDRFRIWYQAWQKRICRDKNSMEDSFSLMHKVNPEIIPRNHKVEEVLNAAENFDLKPFHKFLKVLQNPYEEKSQFKDYQKPRSLEEESYRTFCGT